MAIHSLMMASLATEKSRLLVDNSQMPYHGNSENQPQRNRNQMPQVRCGLYDDGIELITQVEPAGKFIFSNLATKSHPPINRPQKHKYRRFPGKNAAIPHAEIECSKNKQPAMHNI